MALVRTGSGYLTGQILWNSVSNGPAANTSTVTATLQIQRSALNATTGTFKGTFTVGGVSESLSWYGTLPTYEWVTIKTITTTVSHNADGNGSCYLYAIVNGPTGTTMEGTNVSGESTVALDWIPRFASIISATDFTDEGNPTITYSNPAGTAVDALTACISITGAVDDVNYRDVPKTETEYTFHLTEAERNTLRAAIPNSQTGKFQFHLATTMDDVWEHPYVYGTMRIVNANPTISPAVTDTNEATKALTGNPAILVALHSKASVTINASAKKYATIASKRVEHGAAVLTGDGTLSITNHPIKFTVTDSRGFSTTQYAANTIIPYIDPTCEIGNNMPEADGAFALVVSGFFYNGSFGAKANSLTVQYRYKTAGGSYGSWTTFGAVSKNGNNYTATADLTGLDYQTTYVFQARVIDAIHTSGVYASEKNVIAKPVFDWGQNDFRFNVPIIGTNGSSDGLCLWTDNEGGNIRIYPPSGNTYTDFWEMDSFDSCNLRIFTHRKSTNPYGSGYIFPLVLHTDGSISVDNAAQTRNNLGITDEDNNIRKFLALSATTSGGWIITDFLNIDTANQFGDINRPGYVVAGQTHSIPSGLSHGIREVFFYNPEFIIIKVTGWDMNGNPCVGYQQFRGFTIGWQPWEWENPPMAIGVEYRTTERWDGKPVYTKCVNCGALANKMSVIPHNITMKNPISCVVFVDGQFTAPSNYQEESKLVAYATYANVFIYSNGVGDAVGKTVYAILKYTKD